MVKYKQGDVPYNLKKERTAMEKKDELKKMKEFLRVLSVKEFKELLDHAERLKTQHAQEEPADPHQEE